MTVEPKKRGPAQRFLDRWGDSLFVRFQTTFERKTPVEAEKAGERLGVVHYILDSKHRKRALLNLHMAYPDWPNEQCLSTAKNMFRHFGRIAGDFMTTPNRTAADVIASAEVEGAEYLEEAESKGCGVLLITGHFGNWERYAQWMAGSGKKVSVIARDANQVGVQARVLNIRKAAGVDVLSRGQSARESLVRLRRQEMIGILFDQNSTDCFVPFYGKPCGTVLGPATLHRRTSAVLLPTFCVWLDYGKYRIVNLPPIDIDNMIEDTLQVTALLNQSLETMVRAHPEQWLWMHDRWKSARRAGLLGSQGK